MKSIAVLGMNKEFKMILYIEQVDAGIVLLQTLRTYSLLQAEALDPVQIGKKVVAGGEINVGLAGDLFLQNVLDLLLGASRGA